MSSSESSALVIGFTERDRDDLLVALDRFGYDAVATDSVQQAIEATRGGAFKVAFLAGSGAATDFQHARQLSQKNGPGVLLCTDSPLRHDLIWARSQGVVGFILKPFDLMRVGHALTLARA